MLAKIDTIEVRLYKDKPNELDLMVTQRVENELRENLDLKKLVIHIKNVIAQYKLINQKEIAIDLSKLQLTDNQHSIIRILR